MEQSIDQTHMHVRKQTLTSLDDALAMNDEICAWLGDEKMISSHCLSKGKSARDIGVYLHGSACQ